MRITAYASYRMKNNLISSNCWIKAFRIAITEIDRRKEKRLSKDIAPSLTIVKRIADHVKNKRPSNVFVCSKIMIIF